MACNEPLHGWFSRERTALGKRAVTFDFSLAYSDMPISVPCGKCAGCKLGKARDWSVRCAHEAQLWPENVFATLTYGPEDLAVVNGVETLRPRDFVLFMKRLRKVKNGVRFFQCGEYGALGRPHHHVLLFNCEFTDKYPWRRSGDFQVYRSGELEKLWPHGHSEFGGVSQESAGYVARYSLKKVGSELRGRVPEYLTMSRRPGIGAGWIEKFESDVYPSDELVIKGRVVKPPRFYDDVVARRKPGMIRAVMESRIANLTDERKSGLRNSARETILERRVSDELRRNLG